MSPITTNYTAAQFGNAIAPQDDRITLPFANLWMYWTNGNPAASKENGAQYYGGWAADADEFAASMGALGKTVMPANFSPVQTWTNREGNEYNVITTRAVFVAPIATRLVWSTRDDGKSMSHLAMLCYLATLEKTDGKVSAKPYAPIVLTAKSYSSTHVQNAFKQWAANTAAARAKYAPGVPANLFWYGIGTFGDTRQQVMVGKGAQSPIVPAQAKTFPEWTEAHIEMYFVGDEVAAEMLELKKQAAEWLADTGKKNNAVAPNASIDELNAALGNNDDFAF